MFAYLVVMGAWLVLCLSGVWALVRGVFSIASWIVRSLASACRFVARKVRRARRRRARIV
ncbi:hypothetical protein [Raoultibacter timonensis]|uniref:Uncharacterized protein n=1 Tax=Raoultibacter timonensis TaxID=1907662 RepID=A0ABM7WF44_9ACTN|nr:hypothetical protein [Raoultibacter timonensis]BDE94857.1 hypothetical protein CE91St30_01900 [Raoultibacter timonensis]BDF49460.1 hypothetical protein CE91St31_01900 [Raoultibacter timonensis]